MLPAAIIGTAVYFVLWYVMQRGWRSKLDMKETVEEFEAERTAGMTE